jgi:hypothetical protein
MVWKLLDRHSSFFRIGFLWRQTVPEIPGTTQEGIPDPSPALWASSCGGAPESSELMLVFGDETNCVLAMRLGSELPESRLSMRFMLGRPDDSTICAQLVLIAPAFTS